MLVFAPHALPDIFQSLIIDYPPSLRNSEPANVLYMLARFACLNCDHDWLEDLVVGATDAIEDTFFVSVQFMAVHFSYGTLTFMQNRGEDLTCLVFWLYNITIWLHLMRCDEALKETCEMLGSYTLIEEILNSVFGKCVLSLPRTSLMSCQSSLSVSRKGGLMNSSTVLCWITRRYRASSIRYNLNLNGHSYDPSPLPRRNLLHCKIRALSSTLDRRQSRAAPGRQVHWVAAVPLLRLLRSRPQSSLLSDRHSVGRELLRQCRPCLGPRYPLLRRPLTM